MNVLVLGGGGFIGSHLTAKLAGRGDKVFTVDLTYPNERQYWWRQAFHRMTGDLRDPSVIKRAVGISKPELVIHTAADMGGVGYFHSDADRQASLNNLAIDHNVFDAVTDVPVFYCSSACAYPEGNIVLQEGMLGGGPADAMYGEVKRLFALMAEKQPNVRVGILHTIYGPGQETTGQRSKFPPAICQKVYDAWKTNGTVEVWGNGEQTRTFLYVDDAVERILKVIDPDHYDGPVNIGSDELVSINQCVDALCAHAGINPTIGWRLDFPVGVTDRGCDNTLFHQRYGPASLTSAATGFARLYDWIAQHDRPAIAA